MSATERKSDDVSIEAVNLYSRLALASDGRMCAITNMLDGDGDDTDEPDRALAIVVHYDEETWVSLDLSDFRDVGVN